MSYTRFWNPFACCLFSAYCRLSWAPATALYLLFTRLHVCLPHSILILLQLPHVLQAPAVFHPGKIKYTIAQCYFKGLPDVCMCLWMGWNKVTLPGVSYDLGPVAQRICSILLTRGGRRGDGRGEYRSFSVTSPLCNWPPYWSTSHAHVNTKHEANWFTTRNGFMRYVWLWDPNYPC